MRSSELSAEILKAEKAKDDRKRSRSRGFSKMAERDKGWQRLKNGALVRWHVPTEWSEDMELPNGSVIQVKDATVPPETFEIDGKIFNAEELRRWLRWA